MVPFEPAGEQARWRTVYALLVELKVGETLTYQAMAEALELDVETDRHALQMAMRRAAKELEIEHRHAVAPEPNVGYRVVEVEQHLVLAKQHQRRAGKSLVRAHSKVANVDLTGAEPNVVTAVQVLASALSMQMEMSRRLSVRQDRLEAVVDEMQGRSSRTDAEVAKLQARLDKLEQTAS